MSTLQINETLFTGRPDTERIPKENAVYDMLDRLQINYWRIDHDAADTMEDCIRIAELLGTEICKNLFLCNRQKTTFYLLMIPAHKEFRTKDLSRQINSARLSFAGTAYMEEFLHIEPGSVSVLGLMNDKENHVQLLIDEDVLQKEFFGCHPCINTSSLKIRTDDLLRKILPDIKHEAIVVKL